MHYEFSPSYYICLATNPATPANPHVIPFEEGDLDGEEPLHQYYRPNSNNESPTIQPRNATPKTNRKVNWLEYTKPLCADQSNKSADFRLAMDLMYLEGEGESVPVVNEGASADVLLHTAFFAYSSKLAVHDSNLQILDQTNFSNIPKTPLDYRKEVGPSISLKEAQDLTIPSFLSPLQQELMSWHHLLYHLPYRILFCLTSIGFLPKPLLEFQNKPTLCVACQFGQAHNLPWRVNGNKSGSIQTPE